MWNAIRMSALVVAGTSSLILMIWGTLAHREMMLWALWIVAMAAPWVAIHVMTARVEAERLRLEQMVELVANVRTMKR